jgi:iron complex outermembrane receptor protein
VAAAGAVALAIPTKGKELVLTPDKTFSANARYDFGWIDAGFNVKYQGKRWLDDMNTVGMPDTTTVDFDARMPITWWGMQNTYLQFNASNLMNARYPWRPNTVQNATAVAVSPTVTKPAQPFFYEYNSPRTLIFTLHAEF